MREDAEFREDLPGVEENLVEDWRRIIEYSIAVALFLLPFADLYFIFPSN